MPWSAVWRGWRRSMDTNRCHRASGCALEARRTAIALLDELQVSVGPGSEGRAWQFHVIRRASCKTSRERICLGVLSGEVRGARWTQIDAIAQADVPCRALEGRFGCQMNCRKVWDRALRAVCGSSVSGRRSSGKSSRERICPGVLSGGVRVARWTQIDAIARADMPWRPVERRLPC